MSHDKHMAADARQKLHNTLLFRYIDESRRDEIYELSEVHEYAAGDTIVREGEESPHIYLVVEGNVSVTVTKDDGAEAYICTIGEGDIFGEAGIFLNKRRTANVVGIEKTTVLRIGRENLLKFIKREPASGIKILMIIIYGLLKKLREANIELAFERKADVKQEDIDVLVASIMKDEDI